MRCVRKLLRIFQVAPVSWAVVVRVLAGGPAQVAGLRSLLAIEGTKESLEERVEGGLA